MRRDDDPRPAFHIGRIRAHQLDHLIEGFVVEPIDLVVQDGDLARRDRVDVDEGAQHAVDQDGRLLGHRRQIDVVLQGRLRGKLQDLLGHR